MSNSPKKKSKEINIIENYDYSRDSTPNKQEWVEIDDNLKKDSTAENKKTFYYDCNADSNSNPILDSLTHPTHNYNYSDERVYSNDTFNNDWTINKSNSGSEFQTARMFNNTGNTLISDNKTKYYDANSTTRNLSYRGIEKELELSELEYTDKREESPVLSYRKPPKGSDYKDRDSANKFEHSKNSAKKPESAKKLDYSRDEIDSKYSYVNKLKTESLTNSQHRKEESPSPKNKINKDVLLINEKLVAQQLKPLDVRSTHLGIIADPFQTHSLIYTLLEKIQDLEKQVAILQEQDVEFLKQTLEDKTNSLSKIEQVFKNERQHNNLLISQMNSDYEDLDRKYQYTLNLLEETESKLNDSINLIGQQKEQNEEDRNKAKSLFRRMFKSEHSSTNIADQKALDAIIYYEDMIAHMQQSNFNLETLQSRKSSERQSNQISLSQVNSHKRDSRPRESEEYNYLKNKITELEDAKSLAEMELNNRPTMKQMGVLNQRIKEMTKQIKKQEDEIKFLNEDSHKNYENISMSETLNDYRRTLSKLYEIYRVTDEHQLIDVAYKVNNALRALPVLENFCNDVCKEVFEFEETERNLGNDEAPLEMNYKHVVPLLRKWKSIIIDSEEIKKTYKEVEQILRPVLEAMGVSRPSEMDVLVAIQSLKDGYGQNYQFLKE